MSYDKYRNWPLPTRSGNVFPVTLDPGLKDQVLKDLKDAKDEVDKLEILDSFEAYVERWHQQELAEQFTLLVLDRVIRPLLVEFAKAKMPGSMPVSRARAMKA